MYAPNRSPAASAARGASDQNPPAKRISGKHKAGSLKFQDFAEWPEQLSPKRQSELDARAAAEQAAIQTAAPQTADLTTPLPENVVRLDAKAAGPCNIGPGTKREVGKKIA